MDGLPRKRENDAGNETSEFGRCRRWIDGHAWCPVRPGVRLLGDRLDVRLSEPTRQATVADRPDVCSGGGFGAQHCDAQVLVVGDGAHISCHRIGASDFFLRASARSKLRRCTLMPNWFSMAASHSGVVSSGWSALRLMMKARTSAEIL